MKSYDAYLFDWDGTIAQTLAMWLPIVQQTIAAYGVQVDDKEVVSKVFGRARVGMIELGIPESDLDDTFKRWDAQAQADIAKVPLYPGFKEVAQVLRRKNKKLGVITATVRPTLQQALDANGLADTFDVIVAGGEAPDKPSPEGILLTLKELGVTADHAVMLGDSEKDIQAAHNAGIDSVLFHPQEHGMFHGLADLRAYNPTYIIGSWQELRSQLQ